jgi:hypothetical protein
LIFLVYNDLNRSYTRHGRDKREIFDSG